MTFFEVYFSDATFAKEETAVCCPFPHHTESGLEYYESNPSAHINIDKGLFHCKVCGEGLSEVGFIAKVLGTTFEKATELQHAFKKSEDVFDWETNLKRPENILELISSLGISDEVTDDLKLGTEMGEEISFPVIIYNRLLDVRSYRPGLKEGKIRSRYGAISGLIIPYDLWRESDKTKWTILCAGEKDMAVARSNGFNAITLTGGERALPVMLSEFKDRKVAICYDNDDTGIAGAKSVACELIKYCKEVKVVTGFHEICKEKGEDITDFFTKYGREKKDLIYYINKTAPFTPEEAREVKDTKYPNVTLLEATAPKYVNRIVQSNVQVVATYEKALTIPTTIIAKKIANSGDIKNNKMLLGTTINWTLKEDNLQDILKLMDNNFDEEQIRQHIRELLNIPKIEHDISITKPTKETVYKCNVVDLFDSTVEKTTSIEFEAYVLKKKLEAGKKYRITYKIVPHPYKGQQLTMLIMDVEESSDSISNFKLTDEVKQHLNVIRNLEGNVSERVDWLTERVKAFTKYNGYNKLIQAIDFSFNTVLEFNFGSSKNIRGYLDTIVVAESRVGKSSTAQALQQLYGLGVFTSLAGNSATVSGLIGGSNKVNGNYQTRAGLIPQNHRGLVIFEELAKCNANIIKELTDIKSSNQVRIARVSGSVELPALVRMITLTNVKTEAGSIKSINSYPNGIEVLTDLIGTAEDIARFDLMLVMGDTGNEKIDPFWIAEEPLPQEVYRDRIHWIWSRTPEQVIITPDVGKYILTRCNELNQTYDCYIKIFGTEAWKKVSRLAIAIAGYLVSTDDTYENIVVQKEHVDYAIDYMISIYDNSTFKLKQFVDNEKRYSTLDTAGLEDLQDMYNTMPALLLQLEQVSRVSKSNLQIATGFNNEEYSKAIAKLVKCLFIRFEGFDIVPTERFRKGMAQVIRDGVIVRVGESVA